MSMEEGQVSTIICLFLTQPEICLASFETDIEREPLQPVEPPRLAEAQSLGKWSHYEQRNAEFDPRHVHARGAIGFSCHKAEVNRSADGGLRAKSVDKSRRFF